MIEAILPAGVSSAEAFSDPLDAMLFPEEMAVVAKAVDKRRREFATARNCARKALAGIGVSPFPIMAGERGAPLWPPGVVGSITHCIGYRAAAVARTSVIVTAGIDAEPNEVLPDGVLNAVSIAGERARLRDLATTAPSTCWDRLLFSAKESIYKAWFPLARCWLGFQEADISINAEDGTFSAQLLVRGPVLMGSSLTGFSGRWLVSRGLILTAVTIPVMEAGRLDRGF